MLLPCPECSRKCKSLSGLRRHQRSIHCDDPGLSVPITELRRIYHPNLNGTYSTLHITPQFLVFPGQRCDRRGAPIPLDAPPEVPPVKADDDWSPFKSRAGFELAEFAFADAELSQRKVDRLLELWAATLIPHGDSLPIVNHQDLHQQIDAIKLGSAQWENTRLKYEGDIPETTRPPEWKTAHYDVWHRNPHEVVKDILSRPDLDGHVDYAAYQEFNDEQQQYGNVMSGDWVWSQSVCLTPNTSIYCKLILFSAGQNCFRPTDSRFHVCPNYLGVRQNNGLCRHRSERLLPVISLDRQRPKSHTVCAQECIGVDWIPSNP